MEKDDLLVRHIKSKAKRNNAIKKASNIAISRAVNAKLQVISDIVCIILNIFLIFC